MKSKLSFFKNNKGSILAQTMIGLTLISGITAIIYNSANQSNQVIQRARVTSAMTLTTFQLKLFLQNSSNYYCPSAPCTSSQIRLSPSFDADVQKIIVTQALPACKTSSICKIQVTGYSNFNLDGLKTFNAKIKYSGDFSFRDIDISEVISDSVLGASSGLCNDLAAPLFAGYDNLGNIICNPVPRGVTNQCPSGQYISSVDNKTLQGTCSVIGVPADCSAGDQVISQINWIGQTNLTYSCADRQDPYTYFGFTINPVVATPVNGVCGSANNTPTATYPTLNHCSGAGLYTATDTAGTDGFFNWNCSGLNGGITAACTAPMTTAPVNGVCGSANNTPTATYPISGHCSQGSYVLVDSTAVDGTFDWRCNGQNGGSNQVCNALKDSGGHWCLQASVYEHDTCGFTSRNCPVDAESGASCTVPNACQIKNCHPSGSGSEGTLDRYVCVVGTCPTPVTQDGICGSANGVATATVPSTGLCAGGTSTVIDSSGTDGSFNWECQGTNGPPPSGRVTCSAPAILTTGVWKFVETVNQSGPDGTLSVFMVNWYNTNCPSTPTSTSTANTGDTCSTIGATGCQFIQYNCFGTCNFRANKIRCE